MTLRESGTTNNHPPSESQVLIACASRPPRRSNRKLHSVPGAAGISTGTDTFRGEWLPNKHLEISTLAAYRPYLNKQFYPAFGERLLNKIPLTMVQHWVITAKQRGLAPRSIKKYHVLLNSIFRRAVHDQILVRNPCEHTELPKVVAHKSPSLTPDEFDRLPGDHAAVARGAIQLAAERAAFGDRRENGGGERPVPPAVGHRGSVPTLQVRGVCDCTRRLVLG